MAASGLGCRPGRPSRPVAVEVGRRGLSDGPVTYVGRTTPLVDCFCGRTMAIAGPGPLSLSLAASGPAASREQAMTIESLLPGGRRSRRRGREPPTDDTYETAPHLRLPGCGRAADQGPRRPGDPTAFPIQALTIADAMAGRDVCGKAKTGSGKTLAFGLPLLQRTAAA